MTIRSAISYSIAARYSALVLQFVTTIILARLLSPTEIGVYSVGASIVLLAQMVRDFGTSAYIIQEPDLTEQRLRTAFTLTLIVAWSIAAFLYIASDWVAAFYSVAGIGDVLRVLAANFLLIPIGSTELAVLRREMNFHAIMIITIVSTAVHSAVSILLASLGLSFISLAWAAVAGTTATVGCTWLIRKQRFVILPSLSERRRVLSFGLSSTTNSIASELGHSAPDMILGRTLGMESTGLFSRAMGFVQLFERFLQDIVRSVMLPYLASEARSGNNLNLRLREASEVVVSSSWLMIAISVVFADSLIHWLYGTAWAAAAPIAQWLCLAMAVRCIGPTLAAGLVANGQMRTLLKVTALITSLKVILLIALSPLGLLYSAQAYCAAEVAGTLMMVYYTNEAHLLTWRAYLVVCAHALLASCLALMPYAVWLATRDANAAGPLDLLTLAAVIFACVVAWFSAVWFLDLPPKEQIASLALGLSNQFAAFRSLGLGDRPFPIPAGSQIGVRHVRRAFSLVRSRWQARRYHWFDRNLANIAFKPGIVSFTFDDFPATAATHGAAILESQGWRGTFYLAPGLLGQPSRFGQTCTLEQVEQLQRVGHEIGGHSYFHICYRAIDYFTLLREEERVDQFFRATERPRNLALPFGAHDWSALSLLARRYDTIRSIHGGLNRGTTDLNLLKANALYQSTDLSRLRALIAELNQNGGWLIIYTHDVREAASDMGCTPRQLQQVVDWVREAKLKVRTVKEVAELLKGEAVEAATASATAKAAGRK